MNRATLKTKPKKKNSSKLKGKDLIAGIYWDKNSAAKKVIYRSYRNEPFSNFMRDLRDFYESDLDLEDIMNHLIEVEGV